MGGTMAVKADIDEQIFEDAVNLQSSNREW